MIPFHHPDFCMPVIRHKVAAEVLALLEGLGALLLTRGRSLGWTDNDPQFWPFRAAAYRLRKDGVIASCDRDGGNPVLELTPEGDLRLPDELRPERRWKRKWNGIWYVLLYDVPEIQRAYRDVLRRFLHRLRMGGLQGSVWVSPFDIRSTYADLVQAGGIANYAVLFEARTVLGQSVNEVVLMAWDFGRIGAAQAWYRRTAEENLRQVIRKGLPFRDLLELAREETAAYLTVMKDDPLLPSALWPAGYFGPETVETHRRFQRTLVQCRK